MTQDMISLGFDQIIEQLKDQAVSRAARRILAETAPLMSEGLCRARMEETTAARRVMESAGTPPKTVGEVMQCVYASLAACYARAIRELESLTGKTYTSVNIVGGGCQDVYLNELTAAATGLEVVTGPVEGTAIGNLIVQMVASGEFAGLAEARRAIVRG